MADEWNVKARMPFSARRSIFLLCVNVLYLYPGRNSPITCNSSTHIVSTLSHGGLVEVDSSVSGVK